MDPRIDWPNAWEGGRLHGREAVAEYWLRQFESIDSRIEPRRFTHEGDGAIAVDVHQVVRDAGSGEVISEGDVIHRWRLEGGRVRRMDVVGAQGGGESSSR